MPQTVPNYDDALINPHELLKRVGVEVGDVIGDFGVGRSALFAVAASEMVSNTGTVYAVDVVKQVLEVMESLVKSPGHTNIIPVWSDLEVYGGARRITDGSVDVGILSDVLSQSSKRPDLLKEVVRMMKPGGRLLVIDWKPVDTAIGPPLEHRMASEACSQLAHTADLKVVDTFEAGDYHWGMLLQK